MPAPADVTPSEYVAAPMRAALDGIVTRGAAAFGVVVAAACLPAMPVDEQFRVLTYHLLPALLGLYLVGQQVRHAFRARPDDPAAWQRAREMDSSEARLARLIALAVPAGCLLAGAAVLGPHLADPDDQARVLGVFLPLFVVLWLAVAFAWTDDCRRTISRAVVDCDQRFRAYWAGISSI